MAGVTHTVEITIAQIPAFNARVTPTFCLSLFIPSLTHHVIHLHDKKVTIIILTE